MQGPAGALEFSGLVSGANWVASGGCTVGYTWFLRRLQEKISCYTKGKGRVCSAVDRTEHFDVSLVGGRKLGEY